MEAYSLTKGIEKQLLNNILQYTFTGYTTFNQLVIVISGNNIGYRHKIRHNFFAESLKNRIKIFIKSPKIVIEDMAKQPYLYAVKHYPYKQYVFDKQDRVYRQIAAVIPLYRVLQWNYPVLSRTYC